MTELLYLTDNYQCAFASAVDSIDRQAGAVVLSSTLFHPRGGHQDYDTGTLLIGDKEVVIKEVKSKNGDVYHFVKHLSDLSGLKEGTGVRGFLNWRRRYQLMKTHTAQHLLSALASKMFGLRSVDMSIEQDKGMVRLDDQVSIEQVLALQSAMNECIRRNLPVHRTCSEGIFHVEIEDVDERMCGCTHVRWLGEIGKVVVSELAGNKLYFRVGEEVEATQQQLQEEALSVRQIYPSGIQGFREFAGHFQQQSRRNDELEHIIQDMSSRLLKAALEKGPMDAGSMLIIESPHLDIKQVRKEVTPFLAGREWVVIVICKNSTVLVFSSHPDKPAASIMEILKNSALGFHGGGNGHFGQGGPWIYDAKETRTIIECALAEPSAFCD